MDTTEEYIDMCRESKEIQKQWVPFSSHAAVGDIYAELRPNTTEWKVQTYTRATSGLCIWLPRQDQLQDMLGGYTSSIGILIKYINDPNFDLRYFSWEQAWLCIVMHEKYNKTWNGTEWT